jgi:hypothetical protein
MRPPTAALAATPIATPAIDGHDPCRRIMPSIEPGLPPTAMRIPISRVRRLTV